MNCFRRLPDVRVPCRPLPGYRTIRSSIQQAPNAFIDRLGSADKSLELISSARHGILNEDVGDIQARIQSLSCFVA